MEIIRTVSGGLWVNPAEVDGLVRDEWFEPDWWAARDAVLGRATGRGAVWFVDNDGAHWAIRHYRRGGLVGRFNQDRYLYTGPERVRSIAEARLLQQLVQWNLPTATPVAARYRRSGPFYRADLITRVIDYDVTLAQLLAAPQADAEGKLGPALAACGAVIARFHRHGVNHRDLNCHNLLVAGGAVHLIDLDRGRIEPAPGRWQARNLARLRRSAEKVVSEARRPALERHWSDLERAYRG